MILDPDTCMYDAYIYVPWSLTLMHVCMMHISMILDPWLWCMCVWCTFLWSWTLILKLACMYGAYIYDAANFVTNDRTNEQGDSRSRMFTFKIICFQLENFQTKPTWPIYLTLSYLPDLQFWPKLTISTKFYNFDFSKFNNFDQIVRISTKFHNADNAGTADNLYNADNLDKYFTIYFMLNFLQ